jgi:hypothetical protein
MNIKMLIDQYGQNDRKCNGIKISIPFVSDFPAGGFLPTKMRVMLIGRQPYLYAYRPYIVLVYDLQSPATSTEFRFF